MAKVLGGNQDADKSLEFMATGPPGYFFFDFFTSGAFSFSM